MAPPTGSTSAASPVRSGRAPSCGREIPVLTLPPQILRFYGWQPFRVWSTVEWCGHWVEGIPVPAPDGQWRLIPVLGEAW